MVLMSGALPITTGLSLTARQGVIVNCLQLFLVGSSGWPCITAHCHWPFFWWKAIWQGK